MATPQLKSGAIQLSDLIKYIDAHGLHNFVANGSLGDNDCRAPGGIYLSGTIAYAAMPAIKIHFNFIKHGSRGFVRNSGGNNGTIALQFMDTSIELPRSKKERDYIEVTMSDTGAELHNCCGDHGGIYMYRIFNTNLYQERTPEMIWDNQFIVTID